MRKQIYNLVRKADRQDTFARLYNYFIVAVSLLSMLPLMFRDAPDALVVMDMVMVYILFADYILKWITYDFASNRKSLTAHIIYPLTPYAVFDLASLLPSMGLLSPQFSILRALRVFKILRYSDHFQFVVRVLKKESKTLLSVLYLVVIYVFILALAIFITEPQGFENFFDAVYWVITFGYSDFMPSSQFGKVINVVSSVFGIAVVALPAGLITAAFVDALNEEGDPMREPPPSFKETLSVSFNGIKKFVQKQEVKRYAWIMAFSVLMNEGFKKCGELLDLPVWLDVTGTAFASVTLSVTAGLMVGLINNMYLALTQYGISSLFFYSISALVAVSTGLLLGRGKKTATKILLVLVMVTVGSGILDATINMLISGIRLPDGKWERLYYQRFTAHGLHDYAAFYISFLMIKVYDTLVSAGVVAVFLGMAHKVRAWRDRRR